MGGLSRKTAPLPSSWKSPRPALTLALADAYGAEQFYVHSLSFLALSETVPQAAKQGRALRMVYYSSLCALVNTALHFCRACCFITWFNAREAERRLSQRGAFGFCFFYIESKQTHLLIGGGVMYRRTIKPGLVWVPYGLVAVVLF